MKELSIEEKAQRYDKALEAIKSLQEANPSDDGIQNWVNENFPELKESEDEKIRKRIINALVEWEEKCSFPGDSCDMIAWLKKQGEQKPADGTFVNVDDVREDFVQEVYRVLDADSTNDRANQIIDAFDNLPTVTIEVLNEEKVDNANKVEPRQEKLTEFEKAVKQVMEEAIECGDTHNLKADAEMLLSLVHNSSWSEEDEKQARQIKRIVHDGCTQKLQKQIADWFNSIKDRVQPKQEWSEEDLNKIENALFGTYAVDVATRLLNKIKSLRPQSQWKPSDEQIKAVKEAACYSSVFSEKTIDNLIFLSKDLKKLREE